MNHLFDEMINTLTQAEEAMRREIETQAQRPEMDRHTLWQLSQRVRTLARQTDGLLLTMAERHAPEQLLDRVEDLFDFFHEAEDRIDDLLVTGWTKISTRGRA